MGGDLTGKMIVPCVEQPDGSFRVDWLGRRYVTRSNEELQKLKASIRAVGSYPYEMTESERTQFTSDASKFDALFANVIRDSVISWVHYADEKLGRSEVRCYIQPGNDDIFEIDEVLSTSKCVTNPEGRLIELEGGYEMISTGYSNPTPWKCPRDVSETELAERIETMASQLRAPTRSIFNLHCPPYNSDLDLAPELDANLTVVLKQGQMQMVPVGSKAVRAAIEKHRPLLGLHGHIHESRGVSTIGPSICINPGSEYSEGILRGAIVTLENGKVKSYQFTSG